MRKQGYVLCDNDILNKAYKYSANPFVVVMETPENNTADRLAALRKIRRTLQRQLQDKEEEIEMLKEQKRISETEYHRQLQELYAQHDVNEKLITEMADRFSTLDFDQLDEFQRKVAFFIQNGELTRADSLLNTRGSIADRSAELDRMDAAIKADAEELTKRQKAHRKSVEMKARVLEEFAADCYSRYEICKLQHKNDSAAYYLELRASKDTLNISWIMQYARFLREFLNDYEKSKCYYFKALRIVENKFDSINYAVGIIYSNIGDVCYLQDHCDEAILHYNKALGCIEETPEFKGAVYNGLALCYKSKNDNENAFENYRKAIEIDSIYDRKKDLATSYGNLGRLHYALAQYKEAYYYAVKSLNLHLVTEGEKTSPIMAELNNIASVFWQLGAYPKALEYYQKAYELSVEIYGERHRSVALLTTQVANVYSAMADYDNALKFYQKSLKSIKELLGEQNSEVATCYINMGSCLKAVDRLEDAIQYYQRGLEIFLSCYGEQHKNVASCYSNMASLYENAGEYEKAIEYGLKALEIRSVILPQNHPDLASSYNNVGLAYKGMGKYHDAEEYLQKSFEILKNIYGEKHPNVAGAYNNIALVLHEQEYYEKALDYYHQSYVIAVEFLTENHTNIAIIYQNMAKVYDAIGDTAQAYKYIEKAYAILHEKLGNEHSLTQTVLESLNTYKEKLSNN